jgi:hypothetical protein
MGTLRAAWAYAGGERFSTCAMPGGSSNGLFGSLSLPVPFAARIPSQAGRGRPAPAAEKPIRVGGEVQAALLIHGGHQRRRVPWLPCNGAGRG